MRGLFDQDRAMSAGLIRATQGFLTILLVIAAVLVVGHSLPNILSSAFFTGLLQLTIGLGVLLGLYLIVRLLSEILFAVHRLNDRLTILSEDLRQRPKVPEQAAPAKPAPSATAAKSARTAKKPARTPTPKADADE